MLEHSVHRYVETEWNTGEFLQVSGIKVDVLRSGELINFKFILDYVRHES